MSGPGVLRRGRLAAAVLVAFGAFAIGGVTARAQQPGGGATGVPNALQGFSQNRDEPVQIEAASLEVRDKDKVATFAGNVKVVQGDTTMRCKTLVVFYEESAKEGAKGDAKGGAKAGAGRNARATGSTMKAATPGPGGSSQIKRLEARGGVTVTQKDQTASGDTGVFDMRTNTITLQGNVVVSQGANIMRGERLVVDMTSGVSRVDAGKSSGPVRMLIQQNPQDKAGGKGGDKKGGSSPLRSPMQSLVPRTSSN